MKRFCLILGIYLVVISTLEATGTIDWPWLWILSPLWLIAGATIALVILCLLLTVLFKAANGFEERNKLRCDRLFASDVRQAK